jgi:HAD superfamily hydrolase (TIGR01509 family)
MKLKALLFDAGNVLYHRPRRGKGLEVYLKECGLPLIPSKHPSRRELKRRAHLGEITESAYYDALLDVFGVRDPIQRLNGRHILYEEERDIVYFAGIPETLRKLKQAGLQLGVVTNTYVSTNEKLAWFHQAGFGTVWDSFATSCELGVVKPNPEIYLSALEPLNLTPEEAAFVGHAAVELEAAKQLGMTTVAFNQDDESVTADHAITYFPQLLELVRAQG